MARLKRGTMALSIVILGLPLGAGAQDMSLQDYHPRSTLVVSGEAVTRARFPFIDVHGHQDGRQSAESLATLIGEMDQINLAVMVNLSGGSGDRLKGTIRNMEGAYPGRFVMFANVDFDGIGGARWTERATAQFEVDIRNGATGLKIFKNLGLSVRDVAGERVAVDDARLDPIWAKAGELGVPVLIHTGDPAEFWQPHDARNERWLELQLRPRRKRDPSDGPSWAALMSEQHRMFRNHPETTFIAAHLGWLGQDLGTLGELFDELPNVNAGLGAVIYELGRQPRFAHDWLVEYQDRILLGKDSWNAEEFHTYFRVLETADDYFPYYRKYHAFWSMYGLDLPDGVLRKIYYQNALRIIPGIDRSRFPG
ncbi:MAG: hypothetical protein BMS9Abin29_0186 [Gemmatimonadota bacterium]|nr:MAG: hypothetical protein BMS9Abin29_0186 [Gemmatimonadota bacterium]